MSYFSTVEIKDSYGWGVENTPMDEIRAIEPVRLVGTTFTGSVLDPNFWTVSNVNSATTTVANNQISLVSGTNVAGSSIVQSVRKSRYVGGSANRFRTQIRFEDLGLENNYKRWGMFDGTDGVFFKLEEQNLYTCQMKGGIESKVSSGSWNNNTTVPTLTDINAYEIYVTNAKVYYTIGGVLKHTYNATSTTYSNTLNLPCRMENVNTGFNTASTYMNVRAATIYRLGKLETQCTHFHGTTAATTVLKYGAGTLHKIILNKPTGTLITIYDNTTNSDPVIAIISTPSQDNPVSLDYHLPFYTGLTIETTGTWDYTITYE